MRSTGYGRRSSARVSQLCTKDWLEQIERPELLLKLGLALHDSKRSERALTTFRRMQATAAENRLAECLALIWQAHMLDLLGRRDEAKATCRQAADMNATGSIDHAQYGIRYSPSAYARQRIAQPFKRVENRDGD